MKISIITVCYNSGKTIRNTIESVLSQSYPNIEYIIIDGNSKDDTLKIIEEYKDRIAKIISEPDKGIYDAMNKGMNLATGQYIGILNSDDAYTSNDIIEDVVENMRKFPSQDMYFGDISFVNEDGRTVRYYTSKNYKKWKLRFGIMPPHPATFIAKDAIKRVGFYSLDNFKISADFEFFVRAMHVYNISFKRIPLHIVRMSLGGASTNGIKSSWAVNMEIIRACRLNNLYTNMLFLAFKIPVRLLELILIPKALK